MFKNSKLNLGLLLLITLLAFIVRIYRVGSNPPSASWDEISIGWNAYSILKTGMDEHQRFMPLDNFVAFGDYKPPVPVYLTVPFIALFGLTELAIRLPSVIAGTLTVFLVYFLVLEIVKPDTNIKRKIIPVFESMLTKYLPLLVTALLAVSPWHIMLSRAGFEANIALLFIVLGVFSVLSARDKPGLYPIVWIPFVLAIYTFNSSRYFAPLLGLLLIIFSYPSIRKNFRKFVFGILIAAVMLAPIIPHLISKEARLRYAEVNIFNDYPLILKNNNRAALDGFSVWGKMFHNFRLVYARSYLTHYLDNLEPRFLFINGDGNPKFSIQDTGQLYLIEAPFLIYGIYLLLSYRRKTAVLLLLWLLGSIIPSAVARETPHALRIENSLPTWQIFIGVGILGAIANIFLTRRLIMAVISGLYLFCFGYFLHNYFSHYPKEFSGEWQYGYKEALSYTESVKNDYDQIVLSDAIGRPYIYTLYYGKYDPKFYWSTVKGGFDGAGFYHADGFGKYIFTKDGTGEYRGRTLYVLPPGQVPKSARILKTINLLNGTPVLVVFD
jgi:4-amino-4-deoxy-L-arabinose transferase-like glycosyltransferase